MGGVSSGQIAALILGSGPGAEEAAYLQGAAQGLRVAHYLPKLSRAAAAAAAAVASPPKYASAQDSQLQARKTSA
jgi:hypothetical protein